MADNIDFSGYAGRVEFPRNISDLHSTSQCPACFTPLTSTVCSSCELDLGHRAATELHDASLAVSAGLEKRLAIIGRIRYETAQTSEAWAANARAAQELEAQKLAAHAAADAQAAIAHAAEAQLVAAAAAPPTAIPAPVEVAQPVAGSDALPATTPSTAPQATSPADGARKHSSIQVTMLIVGVSLLSIAAIFFLVFAFINFGIIWRSVIIAAITVAALATASLLRHRRLTATAEGIAVFGVVLVYLDAFALRANDFFGLAAVDGAIYWGATVFVTSIAFMVWHKLSSLRTPSIVGFSAFAPGVGLLAFGLAKGGEFGTQPFLAVAAIAAAGLIYRWALPSPAATAESGSTRNTERIISLCTTTLALWSGFFIAFMIAPSSDWSGTIAVVALATIAATHLWAIAPLSARQPSRTFAFIFAGMAAVFAASAVSFAAMRIGSNAFVTLAPPIAAVVVALALESFALRGAPAWKRLSLVGAWSAASVFALTLLAPLFVAFTWTFLLPGIGVTDTWLLAPTDEPTVALAYPGWSVLSLTTIGLLTAASWSYTKVIRRRGPILAWLGAGTLLAAVTLPAILWFTVAAWLVIAAASVALLAVPKTRNAIPLPYRVVLAATAMASGFFGYLISWASHSTWWVGSAVAIILLVVSRRIATKNATRATLLGIATVLVLVASFASALHITHVPGAFDLTSMNSINGIRFSSIAAAVLFGFFAVPLGQRVTSTDRRVTFWLTGVTAVLMLDAVAGAIGRLGADDRTALLLPENATSLVIQLVFLAAIVAWIAMPGSRALKPERIAASIAAAPAAYLAIAAVTKVATLPEFVMTVAPIVAALLVAAAALTMAVVTPETTPRWALDTGVVLVAVPSVVFAVRDGGTFAWFVLVLTAVTLLFLSISRDGLFAAKSWRKHLGWVAIAIATAGLWWRLGSSRVEALEPYVLPLTGVLLITALLIARSEHRAERNSADDAPEQTATSRSAAPFVALGGLLVAILPLGVNAITGSPTRAIVLASVSAALVLVGSFVIVSRTRDDTVAVGIRWQPWLDVAALAGALGVIVTAIGRAIMASSFEWSGDIWLGAALAVLLAAGIGQASRARPRPGRLRAAGSQALAIIPMTAVLAVEISAFYPPQIGGFRALGLLALFAAVTTLSFTVNRAPFGRVVGIVSTGFWAIATVATLVRFPSDLLLSLAPASSALIVAAIALTTTLLRPASISRVTGDLGVIIIGTISVLISISQGATYTWLVLLITAVAVLLLAIDRDGLFSSSSARRHLGWVALALATGGLWWRLFAINVTNLEPFVLPLAGVLIAIALLLARAESKQADDASQRGKAAPVIVLGGLLVGILPLAVNAASGAPLRAITIGAVSAALLLAGSFVIGSRAAQRWWDSAALAGGIGVLVLMTGRAIYLPPADVTRDAWIVGGFILLLIAAFGQALPRNAATDRTRGAASQALGIIAMFAVLVMEIPAFREAPIGEIRALGLVFLFAAVHIISRLLQRAPFSQLVGWIAIGFAGIAAIVGVAWGVIETLEFATVPIAVALLTTGTMHLRDVATARSWLWHAPGLLILLLPSLIETFRDQTLWRIVGLGVVSIAVIIIGLVRKLQAAFVIGVVIVLIHAVATFLPQLRAAYEFVPWWLWLGIGGSLLIAIAIRFEQRRRDLKTVIMKFGELR